MAKQSSGWQGRLLEQAYREVEEAQKSVDSAYARWAELEEKMA